METRRRFDIVLWGGVILLLQVVKHVVGVLSGWVFAQSSEAVKDLNHFLFNLSFMETCWISEISESVLISPLGLKSKRIIEIECLDYLD